MIKTPLLCQSANLVVSAPEVADEDSLEEGSQDLFDHRRAPAFGDEVIAKVVGGKSPQPMGDAIEPPSGLIGVEHSAVGDAPADVMVSRFQDPGEVLPGLGESSGAYVEPALNGKDPDDIVDADAY